MGNRIIEGRIVFVFIVSVPVEPMKSLNNATCSENAEKLK